jgi:hypothetical protein
VFQGLHTVAQGKLGMVYAIKALAETGFSISIPLIDDQPYDLVADDGDRLYRVQVKSTQYKGGGPNYVVQIKHVHHNRSENIIRRFDNTKVDLMVCVTSEANVFIIPADVITSKNVLTLNSKYAKYEVTNKEGWQSLA